MIGQLIIILATMFGSSANPTDTTEQFFTIEISEGRIAGVRQEQLNNKYPENMNHEFREHVSFSYTRYLTSMIISPRDAASGLPTGKRQHKPFSAGGHNELILEDTSGQER